jgi:hypothetical protein
MLMVLINDVFLSLFYYDNHFLNNKIINKMENLINRKHKFNIQSD